MTPTMTRLEQALREALRSRDQAAVAALRSASAAIANAEAVPLPAGSAPGGNQVIAASAAGLGSTEAARRMLTDEQADQIVRAEIAERRDAADFYQQSGHDDRADRLRREAGALEAALAGA